MPRARKSGRGVVVSVGAQFGRLTVEQTFIERNAASGKNEARAICTCSCESGIKTNVRIDHLKDGTTVSCGCLRAESSVKHGMANKTTEYRTWLTMRNRCKFPGRGGYREKGITVCTRWDDPEHGFENFLADMGPRPFPRAVIDRIDPLRGYEKENCRWATQKANARHRVDNRLVTANGETLPLWAWVERTGMAYVTILSRLKRGWTPERAMTEPLSDRGQDNGPRADAELFTHNGETLTLRDWSKRLGIGKGTLWTRIKKGWPIEKALSTPTDGEVLTPIRPRGPSKRR